MGLFGPINRKRIVDAITQPSSAQVICVYNVIRALVVPHKEIKYKQSL